ncbi:MAG: hypothetical protein RL750_498, partial [Bacteroidota bacterium]
MNANYLYAVIRSLLPLFLIFPLLCVQAQGKNLPPSDSLSIPSSFQPEFRRERNHQLVDQEQSLLMASDGQNDGQFDPLKDSVSRSILTLAFTRQVDWLQYKIETDPTLEHREKMNQLFGLEYLIRQYRTKWRLKEGMPAAEGAALVNAYQTLLRVERQSISIYPIFESLTCEGG